MAYLRSFRPDAPPLYVDEKFASVFRRAFRALDDAGIIYAMDGGLPTYLRTGILRDVHDLDLRVTPGDVQRAMQALEAAGFEVHLKHKQWLAQAYLNDVQVDLIFGLGTWHVWVDRSWIERGKFVDMLGHKVRLMPLEETFWFKAYRCSRWAYDGNDLFQLLEAAGDQMDWDRLLELFGEDWEILLSHLMMYRYVFPSRRDVIPATVMDELLRRVAEQQQEPWRGERLCRGTVVDQADTYDQYFDERGFVDERRRRWEELQEEKPAPVAA